HPSSPRRSATMATIAEHIAARNDLDLLARLVAAAERAGIDNAQAWAEIHRGALVSTDIGDTTVADVHAYAVASYEPTPRPGEDPGPGDRRPDRGRRRCRARRPAARRRTGPTKGGTPWMDWIGKADPAAPCGPCSTPPP